MPRQSNGHKRGADRRRHCRDNVRDHDLADSDQEREVAWRHAAATTALRRRPEHSAGRDHGQGPDARAAAHGRVLRRSRHARRRAGAHQHEGQRLMITATIEGGDLDVVALLEEDLSPAALSAELAAFAREQLTEAEKINADALGFTPQHTVAVDGVAGASEDRVRPDGVIVYTFDLMPNVFGWITAELEAFAPVQSGRFRRSFAFFVDGILTDVTCEIPEGREFVFLSSVAYAGKNEGKHKPPESRQAPNGV